MRLRPEALHAGESPLIRVAAAAEEAAAAHHLYYGQSNTPTPDFICCAASEAMRAGHTFYTAAGGLPALREALCLKFLELHGVEYRPSEAIVSVGAGMAIFLSIHALVGPGDNVVIVAPAFSVFASTVTAAGGEPREAPLQIEDEGFRLDIERVRAAIDSRTRMLIVNSPSNPTGWMINDEERRAVWDLALRHDLLLLSDEVYERIVYDRPIAPSMATLDSARDHLLVINSFSKTYNMTGWRLGFAFGNEKLIALMTKLQEFVISSPPAMIQQAGITALRDGEGYVKELQQQYRQRRQSVVEQVSGIPGVSLPVPQGAFYAFPRIDGLGDSMAFVKRLMRDTGVAIAPGSAFGPHGEGHVRISFASTDNVLRPALERFRAYMLAVR